MPQKTGRARPAGPRGLVRNPQVSEGREGEERRGRGGTHTHASTHRLAPSRGPTSAAAHPGDSQSSARPQSPSSPGRNRAAPSPGVGTPGPLCGEEADSRDLVKRMLHCNDSREYYSKAEDPYFSCLMDLIRSIRFFSASASESRGSSSGTTQSSELVFSCT